jgi:hypothetical protein
MDRTDILFSLLIVLCAFIAYWNSLENGFVYDDSRYIVSNRNIRSLSSLISVVGFYRPIRWFSFAADYHFWKLNPLGYHLSNLLLHAACALLVFHVAKLITKDRLASLVASLLFCIYPLTTEAVDNISNRNELFGTFFSLSALYLYIQKSKSLFFLLAVVPLHLFALMSKEAIAISLPIIYIVYDVYFTRDDDGRFSATRLAPGFAFMLVSIVAIGYAIHALGVGREVADASLFLRANTFVNAGPFLINAEIWARTMATGLRLLAYPVNLAADYPVPHISSMADSDMILSVVAILGFLVLLMAVTKRSKTASFGLLWFLVFFLPVSNVIPITSHYMADRYLYAPLIGYCLFAGVVFAAAYRHRVRWMQERTEKGILLALLVLCFALSVRADWRRNVDWKSDLTIWLKTAKQQSESPVAQYNAGAQLLLANRAPAAVGYLQKAISIYEGYNIGVGDREKRKDRAPALMLKGCVAAHSSLGLAYDMMGKYEEAERELRTAIGLQGNDYYSLFNIGIVYLHQGKLDDAIENLKRAAILNDTYSETHRALAEAFRRQGRETEAQREYHRALQLVNEPPANRELPP